MTTNDEALTLAEHAAPDAIVPVVLCGGAGSRLWPLSRRNFAKQHVDVLDGLSLFRRTLLRIAQPPFARPIVLADAASRFLVADEAARERAELDVLLEPEGRDTLAAVTVATLHASRRRPDGIVMILPSDHLIPDRRAFAEAAAAAAAVAQNGELVVFGVVPSAPSTAYGYIQRGAALNGAANRVERFVEKPAMADAVRLVAQGCLWNAGIFCFHVDVLLREVEAIAPSVLAQVRNALDAGVEEAGGALLLGEAFREVPKTSFDYAVMERTSHAAVLPATFAWSDVGDWEEVWRLTPKDEAGVAKQGPVVVQDVRDSYLRGEDRLICAIGIEGLTVVDTRDALLVAPVARAQEVKGLVALLDAEGRPEARMPTRVQRPWGWYQTVDLGERFRVKRIQVEPGRKLSLQKHHHRAEHWIVVRGAAEVTRHREILLLHENQSVYISPGTVHRLANPGKIPLEIVEIQTGPYLEEDDIVRFEDDFGRG